MLLVKNQRNIEKKPIKNQHVTRPIIDPIKQTSEHAFLARLSLEYRFLKNKRKPHRVLTKKYLSTSQTLLFSC